MTRLRLFHYCSLGVATTIAAAWLSALTQPLLYVSTTLLTPGLYVVNTYRGLGGEGVSLGYPGFTFTAPVDWQALHTEALDALRTAKNRGLFPPHWGEVPAAPDPRIHQLLYEWTQEARGFPLPALWCGWASAPPTRGDLHGGIALPSDRAISTGRALPLRPIPLGFAADSLIYAAAWALLFAALRFTTSRPRNHTGLCPRCAYSRQGLAPTARCPECGAAAP